MSRDSGPGDDLEPLGEDEFEELYEPGAVEARLGTAVADQVSSGTELA
ncbi:hypothetical protein ACFQZ4_47555 [Catellatospora coxensis]|uniref:Uncharacterized protein n=1 Tax=Catellatospora coxensis TaxID=310354 RepID=A0A8J3KVW3_9ACTN|nr:hypothetical protein [Catellatospora coxensis]GIG07327.1 hypothetical protein Cco03nite_40270 [Catellatospora coxensis]